MPETNMNAAYESAVRFNQIISDLTPEPLQSLTTSIGIASYHDENTLEELIKKADYALYQAKEKGRNSVMVYQND